MHNNIFCSFLVQHFIFSTSSSLQISMMINPKTTFQIMCFCFAFDGFWWYRLIAIAIALVVSRQLCMCVEFVSVYTLVFAIRFSQSIGISTVASWFQYKLLLLVMLWQWESSASSLLSSMQSKFFCLFLLWNVQCSFSCNFLLLFRFVSGWAIFPLKCYNSSYEFFW